MTLAENFDFSGKICVVSGGGSGIGFACAQKLAEAGGHVFLLGRNEARLAAAAERLRASGGKADFIAGDLSEEAAILHAVAEIEQRVGGIHVLVNSAGQSVSRMLLELTAEEWDRILSINLRAVLLLSRTVAQNMIRHHIEGGRILSISSISSRVGEFGNGAYSVSKAALNCLTQVMGQEFAPYGISVAAVCPGYVDTELLDEAINTRGPLEGMSGAEYRRILTESVPLGRFADPAEIGGFIRWLASPEAAYITGVSLTMAGGRMLI